MTRLPATLILGALLGACTWRPLLPRHTADARRALVDQVRGDWACDDVVRTTPLDAQLLEVAGCDQVRAYSYEAGTGTWHAVASITPLLEAMRCPASDVSVEAPEPRLRIATGCGRQARLDLSCDGSECVWEMTAHAGSWAPVTDGGEP